MEWLAFIANIVNHIPIERVLFPPRDKTKSLEEFVTTMTAPVVEDKAPSEQKTTTTTPKPETAIKESIATACVACALGHFSTSSGLLKEAVRFKKDGISSFEIVDRIGKCLEEQNALERVDLTPEKIRSTPDWERAIAEEALQQSRGLRHRLETIDTMKDLELVAADTAVYYRRLNREWWTQRLHNTSKIEEGGKLSPEDKERVLKRAEELIKEV
jgi:hypothetical protein